MSANKNISDKLEMSDDDDIYILNDAQKSDDDEVFVINDIFKQRQDLDDIMDSITLNGKVDLDDAEKYIVADVEDVIYLSRLIEKEADIDKQRHIEYILSWSVIPCINKWMIERKRMQTLFFMNRWRLEVNGKAAASKVFKVLGQSMDILWIILCLVNEEEIKMSQKLQVFKHVMDWNMIRMKKKNKKRKRHEIIDEDEEKEIEFVGDDEIYRKKRKLNE